MGFEGTFLAGQVTYSFDHNHHHHHCHDNSHLGSNRMRTLELYMGGYVVPVLCIGFQHCQTKSTLSSWAGTLPHGFTCIMASKGFIGDHLKKQEGQTKTQASAATSSTNL